MSLGLVLLLLSQMGYAQGWLVGPKVGATFNGQITKVSGNAQADQQIAPGFSAGVQAIHPFTKHIAFLVELNYIQKNLAYRGNSVFAAPGAETLFTKTSYSLRKNYLELPIGIRLQTGGRFNVFTDLGGYAGYWLSGHWKSQQLNLTPYDFSNLPTDGSYPTQSIDAAYQFDEGNNADGHKDQRLDLGVYLGLGAQYRFGWGNLWLEGRSQLGLTSLDQYQGTTPEGAWYRCNGTAGIYLGASFALGK